MLKSIFCCISLFLAPYKAKAFGRGPNALSSHRAVQTSLGSMDPLTSPNDPVPAEETADTTDRLDPSTLSPCLDADDDCFAMAHLSAFVVRLQAEPFEIDFLKPRRELTPPPLDPHIPRRRIGSNVTSRIVATCRKRSVCPPPRRTESRRSTCFHTSMSARRCRFRSLVVNVQMTRISHPEGVDLEHEVRLKHDVELNFV